MTSLKRFEKPHYSHFQDAFSEIKNGRKTSHWMWFIFPQIKGLGFGDTSKYYAIRDLDEAKDFLRHPILGHNFVSICSELLKMQTNNPTEVFWKTGRSETVFQYDTFLIGRRRKLYVSQGFRQIF